MKKSHVMLNTAWSLASLWKGIDLCIFFWQDPSFPDVILQCPFVAFVTVEATLRSVEPFLNMPLLHRLLCLHFRQKSSVEPKKQTLPMLCRFRVSPLLNQVVGRIISWNFKFESHQIKTFCSTLFYRHHVVSCTLCFFAMLPDRRFVAILENVAVILLFCCSNSTHASFTETLAS